MTAGRSAAGVGIVLVGAELVEGRSADANGVWLARRITEVGARVVARRAPIIPGSNSDITI